MRSRYLAKLSLLLAGAALGGISAGCGSAGATLPDGRTSVDAGTRWDAGGLVLGDAGKPVTTGTGTGTGETPPTEAGLLDGPEHVAPPDAAPSNAACVVDGITCVVSDAGDPCCGNDCTPDTDGGAGGHCNGCVAEGAACLPDVGCCGDLACSGGFCGTGACVPDGKPCGAGAPNAVCCNDDCNGTTCGGS